MDGRKDEGGGKGQGCEGFNEILASKQFCMFMFVYVCVRIKVACVCTYTHVILLPRLISSLSISWKKGLGNIGGGS